MEQAGQASTILLNDYRDPALRHVLDPSAGVVSEARFVDGGCSSEETARRNVVGFGAWMRVGLLRGRRSVFVCLYSAGDELIVRVGAARFRWPEPMLTARRTAVAPRVKRFQVERGGAAVFSVRYWYTDTQTWPDDGDIFSYIDRSTRSVGAAARTAAFWTAHAAGRDVTSQSLTDELDAIARRADGRAG